MYQPECKNDVECTQRLDGKMLDLLTDKLAANPVSRMSGGDIRFIGVESHVLTVWQEGKHVARTTPDVENPVILLGANILVDQHTAAIIRTD
jgi:hypothetical protein